MHSKSEINWSFVVGNGKERGNQQTLYKKNSNKGIIEFINLLKNESNWSFVMGKREERVSNDKF